MTDAVEPKTTEALIPVVLTAARWKKVAAYLDWHGKDHESELIVDAIRGKPAMSDKTTRLTDDELLQFLGFTPGDFTDAGHRERVVASLAGKRANYERMANLTVELQLYEQGLAPKPAGVLVDWDRKGKRA